MYKVFVNDTPLILSTKKELGEKFVSIPIKEAKIKKIVKKIDKGKLRHVNLFHRKKKKLLKHFMKKLPVVKAAGGLVYNEKEEILFIHRNGKWDLPKGKQEKKEGIKETAIREVEEETGVKGLEIKDLIQVTYHVFKRGGKYKLKETHWFAMKTSYTGTLIPENKEGIDQAEWLDLKNSREALKNCYANIKLLFPEKYLAGNPKDRVA